jgi:hypothetical protein
LNSNADSFNINNISVEIEEKLKSLDESVEQRAEQVVTQKSFFFQVKKVARGAAGKVSR